MRVLWSFAKEELAMDLGRNPAEEIKPLHSREWSHEPWPEEVIAKFKIEAQPKPNAQLALALLLYTGSGRATSCECGGINMTGRGYRYGN
jgi:hypothetical protein